MPFFEFFHPLTQSDRFRAGLVFTAIVLVLGSECMRPDPGTPLSNTVTATRAYADSALSLVNDGAIIELLTTSLVAKQGSVPAPHTKLDHNGDAVLPAAKLAIAPGEDPSSVLLRLRVSGADWCRTFVDESNHPSRSTLIKVNGSVDGIAACKRGRNDLQWVLR